jgi:hypothetical protein
MSLLISIPLMLNIPLYSTIKGLAWLIVPREERGI